MQQTTQKAFDSILVSSPVLIKTDQILMMSPGELLLKLANSTVKK